MTTKRRIVSAHRETYRGIVDDLRQEEADWNTLNRAMSNLEREMGEEVEAALTDPQATQEMIDGLLEQQRWSILGILIAKLGADITETHARLAEVEQMTERLVRPASRVRASKKGRRKSVRHR